MRSRRGLLVILVLAATCGRAIAEPTPSAEARAAQGPGDDATAQPPPQDAAPEQTNREALLFGDADDAAPETPGAQPTEASRVGVSDAENDPLAIGGRLYLRSIYRLAEGADALDGALSTPALVDLYLDARPTSRSSAG